jgi:hypothetical protein
MNNMKQLILFVIICGSLSFCYAQKEVEGKSPPKNFTMEQVLIRELPPNLFAVLNFKDNNGNGILEAQESSVLELIISNKGKGAAQGLEVIVEDSVFDREFKIGEGQHFARLEPDGQVKVVIPISAGIDIKKGGHKLKIVVKEHFGYDMDPAFLYLSTYAYQSPKLVFSGLEIFDSGEGTMAISEDGQLQAGEQAKVKVIVQNTGQNPAKNAKYSITNDNENNIFLENKKGNLGTILPGETKEIWLSISPNKRVESNKPLPIYLSVTEEIGRGNLISFQLPIQLDKKPPATNILAVNPDIESLKKDIAIFVYKSNKFSANLGDMINIKSVTPSKSDRKKAIAVIFGIENYKELPPATYADNDGLIIKDYFEKVLGIDKDNILFYKEAEVSGFIFDDVFNPIGGELQKAIVKGETEVFVYYSGHGIPNKDGDVIYLFPYDGKVSSLVDRGYSVEKMYENLNALGAKKVTVFIDACFSGSSRSTEKTQPKNLVAQKGAWIKPKKPWLNNPDFSIVTSSTGAETSLGYDASETGLFTYYFCAGLQGKADYDNNKKITLGELKKYVIENVVDASTKIRGLQTPEFYGDDNYIIVEY